MARPHVIVSTFLGTVACTLPSPDSLSSPETQSQQCRAVIDTFRGLVVAVPVADRVSSSSVSESDTIPPPPLNETLANWWRGGGGVEDRTDHVKTDVACHAWLSRLRIDPPPPTTTPDPSVWGPAYWTCMAWHADRLFVGGDDDDESRERRRDDARRFFSSLRWTLPCGHCRHDYGRLWGDGAAAGGLEPLRDADLVSPEACHAWIARIQAWVRRSTPDVLGTHRSNFVVAGCCRK